MDELPKNMNDEYVDGYMELKEYLSEYISQEDLELLTIEQYKKMIDKNSDSRDCDDLKWVTKTYDVRTMEEIKPKWKQ